MLKVDAIGMPILNEFHFFRENSRLENESIKALIISDERFDNIVKSLQVLSVFCYRLALIHPV
jgi:hypothetical protein